MALSGKRKFPNRLCRQAAAASAKHKDFVYAVTDEIREGLASAGLSEEEVVEDFTKR
jgi:hypothetical protein